VGKSAPEPTPPRETSAASTGTNVSTAIANNIMGNVNTYGPDGKTIFSQNGEYSWTDPYTGESYTVPKFDQRTTLTPQGQKIQGQQDATKLNLATLANNQSGFLNDYMAKPFSYTDGEHSKWALGLYDKLNKKNKYREMEDLRTQLANQGIKQGSDAYDRAIGTQLEARSNDRSRFLLDSYGQGFGTAQATRNQPINEITALMSGSQVSQPQTPGFQFNRIPTTDNAGIIANYDNNKLQAWQAEQAMKGQLMGGLFSLGSSMIGMSDRRAKKDIEKTGAIKVMGDDGKEHRTSTYKWRYKWEGKDAPKSEGVMAQNLEKVKPSAVLTLGSGLKAVDYAQVN
jgi:hypothetical protein